MALNIIHKLKSYYRLKKKVRNKFWFDRIRYLGLDMDGEIYRSEGEALIIEKYNLKLPSPTFDFVLDGFAYLKQIILQSKPIVEVIENGLLLTINGVRLMVTNKQEILIVKEIFTEKIYNTRILPNTLVIDIGMNVGFCSLFFANNTNVEKVISFEPFLPTYEAGVENFSNNPSLENKIQAFSFGLGSESGKFGVPFNPKTKGNASIKFENFKGVKELPGTFQIDIEVKAVDNIFMEILKENPGKKIVLKIDCEGCEYDIIEKLSEKGLLEKMDTVICEWHLLGPDAIITLLEKNNFHHFCISNNSQTGMIYATKK